MRNKIKSAIFGHAVGDALGVPVEFSSRESLAKKPVTDMREYGVHCQPKGTWSDDTSMTMASLDSLSDGLDYDSIMRSYIKWWQKANYTATGSVFDIGNTTRKALSRYVKGVKTCLCGCSARGDNGNGSLMRIIPFILYCQYKMKDSDISDKIRVIHEASALTHAHSYSKIACGIYAFIMFRLLESPEKSSILQGLADAEEYYNSRKALEPDLKEFDKVFNIADIKSDSEIQSSGYVIHSLEASIWCVLNTDSYKECVLKAVNLGEDTDTIGAISGGLAGLLYGIDSISENWLSVLKKKDYIDEICNNFISSCK